MGEKRYLIDIEEESKERKRNIKQAILKGEDIATQAYLKKKNPK